MDVVVNFFGNVFMGFLKQTVIILATPLTGEDKK